MSTSEGGKFDAIFIADVLGVYDDLNGNVDATVRQAAQIPVNDPLRVVPPTAAVTRDLGFGLTASVSFEHPTPSRAAFRPSIISPKAARPGYCHLLSRQRRQEYWPHRADRPRRTL